MDTTLTDPLVGRVLDGRYRVLERVARGGMATVYRALDLRLDRPVAVKVMHPTLAEDDDFVARFTREAKAAAKLSHPNVVAVFDQGSDGGVAFLVMEYVDGVTLRDVLRDRGRLSPRQAVDVIAPVLAALRAAHDAGIVHRDIKPENVLIARDGRVKVADFGLARAVAASHLTATSGLLIGTAAYLSPEQIEHGHADPRSDLYAVGIVLYELLTGRPPYDGATPMAVVFKHVHETVPAPSLLRPDVPRSLDALVLDATQRVPDERPPTAAEMLEQLEAAARSLPPEPLDLTAPTQVLAHHLTTVIHDDRQPPQTRVQTLVGAPPDWPAAPAEKKARAGRPWWRGWRLAVILLLVVTVAAGVTGWWLATHHDGSSASGSTPPTAGASSAAASSAAPAQVAVPDFSGKSQSDALTLAQQNGLQVVFAAQHGFSDSVAAGNVMGQSTDPDQQVDRNSVITLTISDGPQTFPVPNDLVGQSLDAAKIELQNAHLDLGQHPSQYSDKPANTILSVTTDISQPLPAGTKIDVVSSKGPKPIAINDEHGKASDAAVADLKAQGFTAVTTSTDYSDTVPRGQVIKTTPAAGTAVVPATPITVDVSKGPQLFAVPDLYALTVSQAEAKLADVGMHAHVVREISATGGHVLHQSIPKGTMKPRGTIVTIDIF